MEALRHPDPNSIFSYRRGPNGEILAEERDEVPANKEEGQARWRFEMENRFVRGGDEDFDYKLVDENDEYDDKALEEREAQERYFDDQEPEYLSEDGRTKGDNKELSGQTGIQDF